MKKINKQDIGSLVMAIVQNFKFHSKFTYTVG